MFTKKNVAENKVILRRARQLLKNATPGTVVVDHPSVEKDLRREFPQVNPQRISARMAKVLRSLSFRQR